MKVEPHTQLPRAPAASAQARELAEQALTEVRNGNHILLADRASFLDYMQKVTESVLMSQPLTALDVAWQPGRQQCATSHRMGYQPDRGDLAHASLNVDDGEGDGALDAAGIHSAAYWGGQQEGAERQQGEREGEDELYDRDGASTGGDTPATGAQRLQDFRELRMRRKSALESRALEQKDNMDGGGTRSDPTAHAVQGAGPVASNLVHESTDWSRDAKNPGGAGGPAQALGAGLPEYRGHSQLQRGPSHAATAESWRLAAEPSVSSPGTNVDFEASGSAQGGGSVIEQEDTCREAAPPAEAEKARADGAESPLERSLDLSNCHTTTLGHILAQGQQGPAVR